MCSSNILTFSIIEKIRVEKKMSEILCDGTEILDLLKTKKKRLLGHIPNLANSSCITYFEMFK